MRSLMVAAIALATMSSAQLDDRAAAAFLRRLQQAVARDDRAAIASMIRYPLTVFAGGVRIPVTDADDLVRSYEAVFSPALKIVIRDAAFVPPGRATPANAASIAGDRMTIGANAIEIQPIGGRLLITEIHAPLPAASSGSVAGPGGTTRRARTRRRISIGFGRIEHMGQLGLHEREAFVLAARRNQALDIRLTGVSGRDVVVEILNARTRAPIDAKARGGVRVWVGRIPEDGDYDIEVVRLAGKGSKLLYTLTVSLR
jgi:hypothetical protein